MRMAEVRTKRNKEEEEEGSVTFAVKDCWVGKLPFLGCEENIAQSNVSRLPRGDELARDWGYLRGFQVNPLYFD